jgi:WD40 repeat protein
MLSFILFLSASSLFLLNRSQTTNQFSDTQQPSNTATPIGWIDFSKSVVNVETPAPSPSVVPSSNEVRVFSPDQSLLAVIDNSNTHFELFSTEERIPGLVEVWDVVSNDLVTTLDFSGGGTRQLLGLDEMTGSGPDPISFYPHQVDFTAQGDRLLITGTFFESWSGPHGTGALLLWDIRQNRLITWEKVIPGYSLASLLSPNRRLMFTMGTTVGGGDGSSDMGFNVYEVSEDDVQLIFSPQPEYNLQDAAFASDGSFVVFASGFSEYVRWGLFLLDLRSFEITLLKGGCVYSVELSGHQVVFVDYYLDVRELYLMEINPAEGRYDQLVVLGGWPDDIITYTFSEDGAYLWVTTANGTQYTLDTSVIFH